MTVDIVEQIDQTDLSPAYKKALIQIYKNSLDEDNGYWIKPVRSVLEYLIGIKSELPVGQNGINYDDLVDAESPWADIDEKIMDVIFNEKPVEDIIYFVFFSWLDDKVKARLDDPFFEIVFKAFKRRGLCVDEWDLCKRVMQSYPYIIITYDDAPTDFGRAVLKIDFEQVWKFALNMKRHQSVLLGKLYTLLKTDNKKLFDERSDSMLKDVVGAGSNGLSTASYLLVEDEPDKAIKLADHHNSASLYKSLANRAYSNAEDKNKAHYKAVLVDAYYKYGVEDNDVKCIIKKLGKDGLTLLETFDDTNSSSTLSVIKEIDVKFGSIACNIYVDAFCKNWKKFKEGFGYIKSQKAYLKLIFEVLGKYDYSEYLPKIWEVFANDSKYDKNTAADLLSSTPQVVEAYVHDRLSHGNKAQKLFAMLIQMRISKPKNLNTIESIVVPDCLKLNLEKFIKALGDDLYFHINDKLEELKSSVTINSVDGYYEREEVQYYFQAANIRYNTDEVMTIEYNEDVDSDDVLEDFDDNVILDLTEYMLEGDFEQINQWLSKTFKLDLEQRGSILSWYPSLMERIINYCQIYGVVWGIKLLKSAGFKVDENVRVSASHHAGTVTLGEVVNANFYDTAKIILQDTPAINAFAEICFDEEKHRSRINTVV